MANWTRLRRQSHAPRELDGTETIYAAADGTLMHMDPDGSETELGTGGGGGGGDVPFVGVDPPDSPTDGMLWWDPDDDTDTGGGSQPGAVRVLKYDFDFTQAVELAAGVPVWTPAVGDVLLDAWFELDGAGWPADGEVNANADIGVVTAGSWANTNGFSRGFFAYQIGPVPLADAVWTFDTNFVIYPWSNLATDLIQNSQIALGGTAAGAYQIRWRTTNPLSLVVSGDGNPGSDPYDGSAGAGTLYLVVCTPATTP